MRKVLIISLIVLSIFLVGCGTILDYLLDTTDDSEPTSPTTVNGEDPNNPDAQDSGTTVSAGKKTSISETDSETGTKTSTKNEPECIQNSDCAWDESCIDGECGTVANLYVTEGCTKKCNFNSVVLETSDKQTFTLNRGKGDYTAAGAIEWKLVTGPNYCPGDDIIVPVSIKKKYSGKIVNEQYVTVKVGHKSAVITHPNMKSIQFTFTVKSVKEECTES
jgi:hypothetical protein